MTIDIESFIYSKSSDSKMIDFQDLDHIMDFQYQPFVQIYTKFQEMIWLCSIFGMGQIMHLYTLSQK